MKENLTAIFALIDGSSSMIAIHKGVIDGFNEFLLTQKATPGEAIFSLVQFSSLYNGLEYKKLYDFKNIKEIEPLTDKTYIPNGNTPLLDATGKSIDEFGEQLAAIPEADRPSKVVFLVMTDGEENDSHKFTKNQINTKIKHQESKYNWKFVFLGANQDAFSEAAGLGISKHAVMNYQHNYAGTTDSLLRASASISSYRTSVTSDVILNKDENSTTSSSNAS